MKKHPLRFMGFLGLVGLAGLFTGNYGLFGFFGFFGFFALAREIDDEMLRKNMARAGFNAFIVSLVGFPVAVIVATFIGSVESAFLFFVMYFAALFAVQILTFVFSFNYYEKRGNLE